MTYFGWAGDRPLALLLEQGSQLGQLHCGRPPCCWREPHVALGTRALWDDIRMVPPGPSGFSLGRAWGLLAPGARSSL